FVADELLLAAPEHVPLGTLATPAAARYGTRTGLHALGRAGALPLLLECGLKAREINGKAALCRDQLGEIDRKAVGVVEAEGIRSRNRVEPCVEQLVEPAQSAFDGFEKAQLFGFSPLG